MQSNSALTLQLSRRDPEEFAKFYREHCEALLGFVVRRVYDPDIALDLTAETFAQAYISRQRFRGSTHGEAVAWLYRIARRQVSKYCKRARVERRASQRLGIERPALDDEWRAWVESLADFEGLRGILRSELAQLSPGQRAAVELRVVEELPYADVARRLQISEGAARVRVTRGLSTLAEALGGNPLAEEART